MSFLHPSRRAGREAPSLSPASWAALQNILTALFLGALGTLFSGAELILGVRPFGVALTAAATLYFPSVLLGGAIFTLVTKNYLTLVALLLTGVFRLAAYLYLRRGSKKLPPFTERLSFRVIFAALPLFGTGLYRIIAGGFRFFRASACHRGRRACDPFVRGRI